MEQSGIAGMKAVWGYFGEICKIPRPSKSEQQIIDYLLAFAGKHRLEATRDKVGNVLVRKPASAGRENGKPVILQCHFDMVGEKEPGSSHDFTRDPIIPVKEGEWLRASGTTLGADDGIGIAAQMVILESRELVHGPLECLFTVDEESGMTGARQLRPDFLKGKILINLDSEDEGELFIGCAGGIDTIGTFRFEMEPPDGSMEGYRISVEGMRGGHSGDEIHKSPGNPIKVLNNFLLAAGNTHGLRLSSFDGGNMLNAIPRDAYATVCMAGGQRKEIEEYFTGCSEKVSAELREFEPDMQLKLEQADLPRSVLPPDQQLKFLQAIDSCPHGVISWSPKLEGMVETSTNLASVKFVEQNRAVVTTSQRSSLESAKKEIANRVAVCLESGGAFIEHSEGYPGWTPNTDSEILNITKIAYRDLFGKDPVVRAIHAGLECGLILQRYPGLDMLSFGPTIKGAHTPAERIHTGSTEKFWKLLLEVLRRIP
jgi:dipeptidase D